MPTNITVWFQHGERMIKMNEAIYSELPSIYRLLIKLLKKDLNVSEVYFTEK